MSNPAIPSAETLGGSPGAILRRCREFHGLTLEEASETTKIGISHLKALEDDQIREFANQAYLKGFLRIYATYLGLNSDDVARMYEKLFGGQAEKTDSAGTAPAAPHRPRRLISLKKLLFPSLLLVAILITATFFKRPPAPLVRQQQPIAVSAPSPPNSAVQAIQSSARTVKSVRNTPPPAVEINPAPPGDSEMPAPIKKSPETTKGFILKIRVTQNGTLTATVDGSGAQQYELTMGDIIEWKAEKKVSLELSNAGGVDVEFNGKPFRSLGTSGKPAYVEFDATGIKQ